MQSGTRTWRTLVALAALTGGALAVPLAGPAAAADPPVSTCETLAENLLIADEGATVRLDDTECFGAWEIPDGKALTLEGVDQDPGPGVQYPILNGSQNENERILRANNAGASVIRNLVFRLGEYSSNGAAIKVQRDSAVTIENNIFEGNTSGSGGGAISMALTENEGTTTIRSNVFRPALVEQEVVNFGAAALIEVPNSANQGGAIYLQTPNPLVITGNRFERNEAQYGGGLFISSSADVTLANNVFDENVARVHGGGAAISGVGDTTITVNGNDFLDNEVLIPGCLEGSSYGGGGLSVDGQSGFAPGSFGAAATDDGLPDLTQTGNTFDGNTVERETCQFATGTDDATAQIVAYGEYYGGGEWVRNTPMTSRDDTFEDNEVINVIDDPEAPGVGDAEGGGLSVENEIGGTLSVVAHNLVLVGNSAEGAGVGGGAYFGGEAPGVDVTLLHATVTDNSADVTGGGLAGGVPTVTDDLVLQNSIVWGNDGGVEGEDDLDGFGLVTANFSDVCATEAQPFAPGSGDNLCTDPLLVDVGAGDVHQTATSPTLDMASTALTGSLDKDYEGEARIQDAGGDGPTPARPDMGADERTAPAPVTPTPEPEVQANVIAPGSIGEDDGYCLAAKDGGVFTFGGCQFFGAAGGPGGRVRAAATDITAPQSLVKLNAPIVGIAMQPSDTGYWQAGEDGGVFSFGTAQFYGSMGGTKLNNPIVGIATSPSGLGYYLVASDGGVFSFGDAPFLGSMGGTPLTRPIVGITATPSGKGYWLVASDGGVFSFGDAQFFGSTGGTRLNSPIVGMASRPAGLGYWLAAADGGVFTFGDAPFLGNRVGQPLNQPVIGIKGAASGNGYWLIAGDGGVFSYGTAPFLGSEGNRKLNQPVIDMTG